MAEGHIYFHNARPMHVPKGENIYIFDGAVKSIVYGTPPPPACLSALEPKFLGTQLMSKRSEALLILTPYEAQIALLKCQLAALA